MMQKRKTCKSSKKTSRTGQSPKKTTCGLCKAKNSNSVVIAHSLYRKYSFVESHYYLMQFNSLEDKLSQSNSTAESEEEEYLSRYHRRTNQKQTLQRLREVFCLHR